MQMVKNILLIIATLWFAILLFMPKVDLYYSLENKLVKKGIVINEKSIDESVFSLSLKESDIYAEGINLVKLNKINIFTLLFYSSINVNGINIDESLKSFIPVTVEKLIASHSILSPRKVFITIVGNFGVADGIVDLKKKIIRLDFSDTNELNNLKKQLKKDKKGWYYEKSF